MPKRYLIPYIDKFLCFVGAFAFILAGLSACGSSASTATSTPTSIPIHAGPITIGASLPLTGDFATDGQATLQGYQLWVDNINKSGGILGHQVKLDILNDGTKLDQTTTNYQTLITVHHDDLVIGPFADDFTVAAARVAARNGYALVDGSGVAPVVFQAHLHNLFSVSLAAQNTLSSFAAYILSLPSTTRPKTAVYATEQDPYLQPIVETSKSLLEQGGVQTSISEITYPSETTDWNPIADKIIAANPDIVVLGTATNDAVAFVQRFKQQHFNPKVLLEVSGPDQGTQFTGPIGGTKVAEGIFVPNGGWFPGLSTFENTQFQQQYIAKFGGTADGITGDAVQAYSVLQVLKQAIDKAHSIDNATLMQVLRSNTFQSVQGPVKFNSDGQNTLTAAYLFQWQKGNLVPVYPTTNAQGVLQSILSQPGPPSLPIRAVWRRKERYILSPPVRLHNHLERGIMKLILEAIVTGLLTGGVYALMASGLTLVYGVMEIVNIAQGIFVVMGAYLSYTLQQRLHLDLFVGLLVTVPIMFAFGMLIEWAFLRRLKRDRVVLSVLVTFAVTLIIEGLLGLIYSASLVYLHAWYIDASFQIAGFYISYIYVFAFLLSVVLLVGLYVLLYRTTFGYSLRASMQNSTAATLIGIDVERVQAVTFGIGVALAAAGGMAFGATNIFNASSGFDLITRLLVIIVLGGMGSLKGALIASLLMLVIGDVTAVVWSPIWSSTIFFALLVVLLVVRPQGMFGRLEGRKQ